MYIKFCIIFSCIIFGPNYKIVRLKHKFIIKNLKRNPGQSINMKLPKWKNFRPKNILDLFSGNSCNSE